MLTDQDRTTGNQQKALSRAVSRKGNRVIAAAVLLFCCTSFLTGCKDKVKPGAAVVKRPSVTGITMTTASPVPVDEYYETSGTVKARTASVISTRVMGTVTSLKAREGDRVKAGQVLVTIDDRDTAERVKGGEAGYREALKALEAAKQQKSLADITFERYRKLHDEKALTRQELDQVETQKRVADIEFERVQEMVKRAEAALSEARVYHGFTTVTAPVSGVVTERKIDTGSMAVPGTPMFIIEDTTSLRVEAYVDEGLAGRLQAGISVGLLIESIGKEVGGTITEIVPAVDPMSRTFLVKISVPGAGLKSGMYAKVRIPIGKREAILLPKTAVVERGQLTGVFTVDNGGVVTYRLVRVGRQHDGLVEVLSGINPKDRVITEGVDKAIDGGIFREGKKE